MNAIAHFEVCFVLVFYLTTLLAGYLEVPVCILAYFIVGNSIALLSQTVFLGSV